MRHFFIWFPPNITWPDSRGPCTRPKKECNRSAEPGWFHTSQEEPGIVGRPYICILSRKIHCRLRRLSFPQVPKNKERLGARSWGILATAHEVDTRNCSVYTEDGPVRTTDRNERCVSDWLVHWFVGTSWATRCSWPRRARRAGYLFQATRCSRLPVLGTSGVLGR